MSSLHGTTDVATILAAFPSMPMIYEGPQSLKTLLAIQEHLISCAQTFRVDGRPLGLLDLAIPPALYALYTALAYPARTADPGATPQYAPNAGAVARLNTENLFALEYRSHHNERNMDQALINRMYLILGTERAQDLRDSLVDTANPTFLQACARAVALWGHTTPAARDANLATLKDPWQASDGMAKLWRQIKTGVAYAVAAGEPIPANTITDAALICINRTQAYKPEIGRAHV